MGLYKMTEWQSMSGRWHCNDVSDLAGNSGKWWVPCCLLKITPEEFYFILKKFEASEIKYSKEADLLYYSWDKDKLSKCREFKNFINRKARLENFII